MKGKTTCGDEEDASEMEAKPSSLSQRSRCGRGRGFTACPSFPPQRASDLKSCCTDAFHGRACSSECRESEPGNGDHESHQRTDQKGGFPSFRDESQWEKHYEDIFFTSSQLEVIRRCKIERRMSDQGLYSESCMSQAIEKLGNNVTEAKRMGEVTTHNYEQFCVRNEKASSFFSRYVWPATVDSGYKQGRSEEEILIVIEVLRRSHRVVKNRLFSNMNNVTGFRIVFDSWWNYALLRILHLSPEVNHLSPEVNVRGKSIYEFTAVKIMTSLFDFITKDLGDFLKRGTLRDFHKNMGVDLVENVNHTRRILDHCDVLDMECSAVETHVNNLLNQSSPVASRARKEPVEAVFYEQRARSLFTTVEGSQKRHLSPILDKIGSQEFIQFVEGNSIVDPAVEINPHVYRLDMYQNFVDEGFKCAAEGDHYDVRIVFHGTPESNIESILRNGLDPNLRKRQAFGQGEYFARNAALPVLYCCGGTKILVFAVITTEADNRHRDIIVVERRQRQLPIATLSFASLEGSAAMDAAVAFQSQVSRLWREKLEKEKVASEAKLKEKIIRCILQTEYEAASDIYKKACGDDGKPPNSWADEVALYVRDHIRDDEFVGFYFPNLPPRPSDYRTVQTLNSEKCEVEAEKARQAYEKMRNGKK